MSENRCILSVVIFDGVTSFDLCYVRRWWTIRSVDLRGNSGWRKISIPDLCYNAARGFRRFGIACNCRYVIVKDYPFHNSRCLASYSKVDDKNSCLGLRKQHGPFSDGCSFLKIHLCAGTFVWRLFFLKAIFSDVCTVRRAGISSIPYAVFDPLLLPMNLTVIILGWVVEFCMTKVFIYWFHCSFTRLIRRWTGLCWDKTGECPGKNPRQSTGRCKTFAKRGSQQWLNLNSKRPH